MSTMDLLSDRVKKALETSGIKQVDLAKAAKVDKATIQDWLKGRTKEMKGSHLLRAAAALGVRPLWLAEGRGPMMDPMRHLSPEDREKAISLVDLYLTAEPEGKRVIEDVAKQVGGRLESPISAIKLESID